MLFRNLGSTVYIIMDSELKGSRAPDSLSFLSFEAQLVRSCCAFIIQFFISLLFGLKLEQL